MRNDTSILSTLQSLLGDDFNISLFLSVIKRSIIWVLIFILLAIAFVVLYLRYTPEVFLANSTLMMKTEKTAQLLGTSQLLSEDNDQLLREIQVAKSKFILEKALANLPLKVSYYKEGRTKFVASELYTLSPFTVDIKSVTNLLIYESDIYMTVNEDGKSCTLKYIFGNEVIVETFPFDKYIQSSTGAFNVQISIKDYVKRNLPIYSKQIYYFRINNPATYADQILSKLTVLQDDPALKTMIISYKDNNRIKAIDIVNAVTEQFQLYDIERKTQSANQILAFLASQIDTMTIDLAIFQDSLKEFRRANNYLDPQTEISSLVAKINSLEEKKVGIELDSRIINWFYDYIEQIKDLRTISSGLGKEGLGNYDALIKDLRALEDQREEFLLSVSPEHPKIKMIDEKIVRVKNDLVNDVNNIIKRLSFEDETFKKQYNEYMGKVLELPEKEAEYTRLIRKYRVKEEVYLNLLDRQAEYSIAKAGIISDYIILKKAQSSKKPISPNRNLIWMISMGFAIILGGVVIVVRFMLHNTIISLDDIGKKSKAAVLGMVPTVYSDIPISSIVVTNNPKSIVSESLRSLRANLQFINTSPGPKTVAITSTISGEGKTFIAINFGAILSFLGKKVIVIDLDMRRPRLSKVFNVNNDRGMSTILIGKDNYQDCIHTTELPHLFFITSGPIPPNPAELILSEQLDVLIENLKKEYEYIIFDTPPLGLVTDGLDIIKKVNYPIYIFRADYSSKAFIGNLDKLIDENKVTNLSVILNDVGRGVSGYYYGYGGYGYSYGYGYGFGYYSDDVKPQKTFWEKLFNKS
ncbi:MAG: polysaccharide biosynthesis tyrosine autokinase [Chitinophagales bacterium]|nr:polysaccharide biosynthesis tyrosine autokinase [Chitinophagales bacterium]